MSNSNFEETNSEASNQKHLLSLKRNILFLGLFLSITYNENCQKKDSTQVKFYDTTSTTLTKFHK